MKRIDLSALLNIAQEMQNICFANEKYMVKFMDAERMGFDNVTGNLCLYDFDYFAWQGNKEECQKRVAEWELFFNDVARLADSKGYGLGAAQRGFNVTNPIGRYWTLAQQALREVHNISYIVDNDFFKDRNMYFILGDTQKAKVYREEVADKVYEITKRGECIKEAVDWCNEHKNGKVGEHHNFSHFYIEIIEEEE